MPRMFGLDAFRAAAILAVLADHGRFLMPDLPLPHSLGAAGVGGFFALSGYLVGRIALRDVRSLDDLPRFWWRRWIRTLPAAVTVALVVALIDWPGLLKLIKILTFTAFLWEGVEFGFLPHYWSLAVEEWAYVLLPLLLLALRRREPLPWLIAAWFALFVWREIALDTLPVSGTAWFFATPLRLDPILAGVVAAALSPRLTQTQKFWLAATCGPVAALCTLSADLIKLQASIVPALCAATLPGLAMWRGDVRPVARAAIQHVAALSYGLYLVHLPIYFALRPLAATGASAAALATAVAASWLAAMMLRRCVELPALALRDRPEIMRWARPLAPSSAK